MAGGLDAIGNTPLVRLRSMEPDGDGELWAKWEGANPSGSMKDRMAVGMIAYGEETGELRRGMRVVEYTGGSTGSALAMVCAALGYRLTWSRQTVTRRRRSRRCGRMEPRSRSCRATAAG